MFLRGFRPARAVHRLHADAADEPRRELPREPRLRRPRRGRLGRARTCRRGGTSSSTPTAASSTRRAWRRSPTTTAAASSPAGSPTSARPSAATGCGSSTSRRAGSPPATPRLRRQLHRLRPAGAAARPLPAAGARSRSSARRGRSGTGRRGPRCRSAAPWSWWGCEPRLHIPGLGGLSQGPGFANLGASACSPTGCCSRCCSKSPLRRDLAQSDSLQDKSLSFE